MTQDLLKLILLFLFSSTIFLDANANATVANEKRVALVIGNSAYQHTPALINPQNDASTIGASFQKLGFETELKLNLTKMEMDQAIRQFSSSLTGATVAVFYYAGHGIQVNGVNYLVPVDASLRTEMDLMFEVCDLGLVLRVMENSQRVNVLFLDACRDNPLSEALARSMGSGRSVAVGRGLAPVKANAGTLISYATRDGDIASDGKDKNSPYTKALLSYIEQPGLEIHQMLRNVRNDVRLITNGKQTPWEYGSLLNEFYFLGPVRIDVRPPEESVQKDQADLIYWQSIMNDTNTAVFESYLKNFPSGIFTDLAKLKIEMLTKAGKSASVYSTPETVKPKAIKGSIKITSEPVDALVLMNGQHVGRTNLTIAELDSGQKKFEIQKDCYRTEKIEATITAGQEEKINITLTPACGILAAESMPSGAEVWINGRNFGRTPFKMENMPEGNYHVSINLPGYKEKRITINVKADKETVPEKIILDRIIPVLPEKSSDPVISKPVDTLAAANKSAQPDRKKDTVLTQKPTEKEEILKQAEKSDSIDRKYSILALPFSYGNDAQSLDQRLIGISYSSIRKSNCFQLTHSYLSNAGKDDRILKLDAREFSVPLWSNDAALDIKQPIEIGKKYSVDFVLGAFVSATRQWSDHFKMNKINLFLINVKTGKHVETESSSTYSSTEEEFADLLNGLIKNACESFPSK